MGQSRVASPQDAIIAKLGTDLFFQRIADVDFGQDPKAFGLEGEFNALSRALDVGVQQFGYEIGRRRSWALGAGFRRTGDVSWRRPAIGCPGPRPSSGRWLRLQNADDPRPQGP